MTKKSSILIIDDDESVLEMFSSVVNHYGFHNTICMKSSIEAKNYLQKIKDFPSLIFVDFLMPNMNGKELINWVKSNISQSIDFCVVSGCSKRDVDIDVDYIQKPFSIQSIKNKLDKYP